MKTTEEILEVNKQQKEFYDAESSDRQKHRNFISNIWANTRNGLLHDFRKEFDIRDRVYEEHKVWFGDLSDKRVLDLGCYAGNFLSMHVARQAKEYVGIDLSDHAIDKLNKKLIAENLTNAKAISVDFFSDDFKEGPFDLIYAMGVLHHFENFELLADRLNEKLAPGGMIISYDPLETSLPIKILRSLYRPFQSDRHWEWPFNRKVIKTIKTKFEVEKVHGLLGKSKYGILLNALPLSKSYKKRKIKAMVESDWNLKTIDDVLPCMHLTLKLRKK